LIQEPDLINYHRGKIAGGLVTQFGQWHPFEKHITVQGSLLRSPGFHLAGHGGFYLLEQ
jgi:hypothetical protein